MKIYRDKQILVKYRSSNIIIDFDSLFKYRGDKKSIFQLEMRVSKIFSIITFVILFGSIALILINGSISIERILLPDSLIYFLPYLAIFTFLISEYFKRDRDQIDTSVKNFDLTKVNEKILKGEELNVILDRYFSFNLEVIFDEAYFNSKENFIVSLVKQLMNFEEARYFLSVRLGVDLEKFLQLVEKDAANPEFTFENCYKKLFVCLFDEARKLGSDKIDELILLFVLNKQFLKNIFFDLGITDLEVDGLRIWFSNETRKVSYFKIWQKLSKLKPTGDVNRAYTSRATPTLDEFGEDFTREAARGLFMLSIGKEDEVKKVFETLERDNRSAVLVLGEPGVGKTRFIRYLATRMTVEDVPRSLRDFRLVVVDLNKILTKTASIDAFKSALQSMFEEVRISGNIILVLEEFSQVLNIRDEARLEVVNLIINAVEALKLQIIGTSSYNNYVKYIQPLKSLAALFDIVRLNEPSASVSLQILIDEVPRLEAKFGLSIKVSSLKRIVEFASKFDFERVMPDKGIDLLEQGCVAASAEGLNYLDQSIIDKLLSSKIGVNIGNVSESESKVLLNLGEVMHERVIGQDDAINSVVSAIKRSRSGLVTGKRPVASFLFFGPTGVGKTEVAKTLAEVYYGDEKLMVRMDMSEYQEEENLNRLIGYTDDQGNFIGGYLTEAVRSRPFSLVLLDEVEKANKKVLDLFLQVLDEGSITDGAGRKIDFTNTIIIMTSNVGSKRIADLILQGYKYYDVEKAVMSDLREFFRIEFLNRFDKLIMFKPLTKIEIEEIVKIMLNKVNENLLLKGISIQWNENTLNQLAEAGYDPVYGARELRRVVQEKLEDKLADLIIKGDLRSGQEAVFDGLEVKSII